MQEENYNYITSRDPNYFGKPLSDYPKRVEAIVQDTKQKIERAILQQESSDDLFERLLSELGQTRLQLATEQQTANNFKFGERRDSLTALRRGECHFYTNLSGVYSSYCQKVVAHFAAWTERQTAPMFFPHEILPTSFEYELLSYETLAKRGWLYPTKEKLTKAFQKLYHESYPEKQKARRLQTFVELLEKNKFCAFLDRDSPNQIFLGNLFFQKGDKKELLCQYFSRFYGHGWTPPTLMHMDFFQIDGMLKEAARFFHTSLQPENPSKLQESVGALRYLLSHIMPFCRGSASIQEWLSSAIYLFHGQKAPPCKDKTVDLEAFTTFAFEEFLASYKTN